VDGSLFKGGLEEGETMYSDALLAASRRGEQLRYVTEHFYDLQGLRSVPFWAAWLLLSVFEPAARPWHRYFVGIWILFLLLFFAVWLPWISDWYKRYYGKVMVDSSRSDRLRIYLLMLFLLALPAGLLFPSLGAYSGYLGPWFVFLITLPRCLHAATAVIPIRLGIFLYIGGSLAILFLIGCAPFVHLSVWVVNAEVCATLLALSLYDHWLLNHLLNGTHGSFL
jgi:hypothetical protein